MHTLLHTILNRIATGRLPLLNAAEAVTLALLPEQDNLDILAAASAARAAFGPDAGASCGIVNAKSGHCPENCAFCAQSAHHRGNAPVYPLMSEDELLRRAEELARAGVSRFGIVTSGTALDERELDSLCAAAERILRNVDIRLCGSLGMLTEERGRRLKEAGFTRYHHNLETAASHFDAICSTHDYEEDILSLRAARRSAKWLQAELSRFSVDVPGTYLCLLGTDGVLCVQKKAEGRLHFARSLQPGQVNW